MKANKNFRGRDVWDSELNNYLLPLLTCASDVTSMLENTKKREEDVTETFDGKNVNTLSKAGEVATSWDIRI